MSAFGLLVDCLRNPDKLIKQRTDVDANPSRARKVLVNAGVLRDGYPNFFGMGFTSQAFVDIELSTSADSEEVVRELHTTLGVILVYTVFGQVDMRCKVVGLNLKQVEGTAMAIRRIAGVNRVYTSIIVDETDMKKMKDNWANLVQANETKMNF